MFNNRILIVEDEIADWEPLKMFLEIAGFSVNVVEYARHAVLEIAGARKEQNPYLFIITDMELRNSSGEKSADKMGGITVIEGALKDNADLKNSILVLSGRMDFEDKRREKLQKYGIAEKQILIKPVSPDTIVSLIGEITGISNEK